MYVTYILQSISTGKYYIGSANDIRKRLYEHNHGHTKSTRNLGPYKLVYSEKYFTRKDAYRREREFKSYKGGNAFKKLISQDGGVDNRNSL